jgi:hypothetical protein
VILALTGDIDAALEEMTRLEAYQVGDDGARELANQRLLIEMIAASKLGTHANTDD